MAANSFHTHWLKERRLNVKIEIKIPVPWPKLVLISDIVEKMHFPHVGNTVGSEIVTLKDKRNHKG